MDGSNYHGRLPAGRDTRAEDRAAVHTALLMTVVMVLVVVSVVLGLAAFGIELPVTSEFQVGHSGTGQVVLPRTDVSLA